MRIRCPQGFPGVTLFLHTFFLVLLLATVTETEVGRSARLERRLSVQRPSGVSEIETEIDILFLSHTLRTHMLMDKVRVCHLRNGLLRRVTRLPPPLLPLGPKTPPQRLA